MHRLRLIDRVALSLLTALVVSGFIAWVLGGRVWLEVVGVVGTAVGTLGLAVYTQDLARQTGEVVRGSRELEQTALDQLEAARQQVEVARDEAAAAQAAAREARRTRIDAGGPLVDLQVTAESVLYLASGVTPRSLQVVQEGHVLTQGQLHSGSLLVDLTVKLTNYGASPARVVVPPQGNYLRGIDASTGGSRILVLPPQEVYQDSMRISLQGWEAEPDPLEPSKGSMPVSLGLSVAGVISETTLDTITWHGVVKPFRRQDMGFTRVESSALLTGDPAAIEREYVGEA